MPARIDHTGKRYGRLVALESTQRRGRNLYWRFQCDCGSVCETAVHRVISGNTKSCGCWRRDHPAQTKTTHGHSKSDDRSPTYVRWFTMLQRCKPGSRDARHYSDKGITVCDRWREFGAFLDDLGECPPGLTLDRIDNSRGYEPGNCRWATVAEQIVNRSVTLWVRWGGREFLLVEAAKLAGVRYSTVRRLVVNCGMDFEAAVARLRRGDRSPALRST